jgi:regulator of protease activity HflC (stomatin/prohibitin superfamily)
MTYIVISVFLLIVAGILFLVAKKVNMDNKYFKPITNIVGATMVFLFVAVSISYSLNVIKAGRVGVIYTFGKISGQITEGFNMIAPWNNVVVASVQIQSHKFKDLSAFSKETQDVFVDATLNINVSPQAIQDLYRRVGHGYFDVLVAPRVAQTFKDETVKYNSIDIAPNRETIRRTVSQRLEKELSSYSIEVKDLLLDNISFQQKFQQSIENKQVATQKALEEEQNIKVKKALASQAVETARGAAESIYINAERQAAANKKLSESLSSELIQYTMISKLSDKIEVMILPAGQSFMLSPEMLKKTQK